MTRVAILLAGAAALGACAPRTTVPAAAFLDPQVRAAQEANCAGAVRQQTGAAAVMTRRTSSDSRNLSIVNFEAGPVNGYCRVDVDGRVLAVVL